MRKYVTLNRVRLAEYECGADGEDYLSRTVYEPEREIIDTGILDAQGNAIFAISETDPIGFVIHGETKPR